MQIYQGNLKSGTFKSTGSLSETFKSIRKSVMQIYQGNLIQGHLNPQGVCQRHLNLSGSLSWRSIREI